MSEIATNAPIRSTSTGADPESASKHTSGSGGLPPPAQPYPIKHALLGCVALVVFKLLLLGAH